MKLGAFQSFHLTPLVIYITVRVYTSWSLLSIVRLSEGLNRVNR